jgi:threonyl-tRNA synthetase
MRVRLLRRIRASMCAYVGRDHRKIGQELDLFSLRETTGPGLVLWHPKGSIVRHIIETYWKDKHLAQGYSLVYTPHVARLDLWKTSGHFDFYKESMFDQMQVACADHRAQSSVV